MKQSKQGGRPAASRGIRQMDVQARPHGSLSAGIVKRIVDLAMTVLLPLFQ